MDLKKVLLFVGLCVLLLGVRADDEDDGDVIVLTEQNFDSIVRDQEMIVVEFYAPWCGHCKALAPHYKEAASILLENDPPIPLAKVDATENGALAREYGVTGYPTLKIFRNGNPEPYNGPRQTEGIVSYLKKMVGPPAKPLETQAEIDAFVAKDGENDYSVIGFFSKPQSQIRSSFQLVSKDMRESTRFGIVTDADLARKYIESGDGIVAFQAFDDDNTIVYEGKTKTNDVKEWVAGNSLPLVGEWSTDNEKLYRERGLPIAKLYMPIDWENNPKNTRYFVNRVKKVANANLGKLVFTIADTTKFADELEGRLSRPGVTTLFVILDGQDTYLSDEEFSKQALFDFVDEFKSGKLSPYHKSEPVPKSNDGPVTVVVGSQFEEIVEQDDKDVMIEFYAPWCGHCKALAPKYEELGQKMKKHENVVVAKIDATANEFDRSRFEVSGYPTIYFKRAGSGNKKPIRYDGAREVKDMAKFIRKKGRTIRKKKKSSD